MKVGSLCSGYGGIELGLELASVDIDLRWIAENDPALDPLRPAYVPNLGDITRIDWSAVERVDLLTAGFPCQPVSAAGRQLGERDPRWLWPWVRDAIAALKPDQVLLENVRNLISTQCGALWRGILVDLEALGYGVRWLTLGACHVGAAHHRHRVFALATLGGAGVERVATTFCGAKGGALLPTAQARDGDWRGAGHGGYWDRRREMGRTNGMPLDAAVALLPTPTVGDARNSRNATAGRSEGQEHHHSGTTLSDIAYASGQLLPTPRATDGVNGGPEQRGRRGDLAMPSAVQPDNWGRFAEVVARHESLYGPAPVPTEPNKNGAPRLAPAFAEWLMCLPAGHVTAKLARVPALRAIGNGVCPPQLAAAWRALDVSLGLRVASSDVTSTSSDVKEIQDRNASARGRVLETAGPKLDGCVGAGRGDHGDAAEIIEAAFMELVAVWREEADWWEKRGGRGSIGTAKELRQSAARLAGFAIGLTTRPEPVFVRPAEPDRGAHVFEAALDAITEKGSIDPVMDYLTGATNTYEPKAEPMTTVPASIAIVDNPFASPAAPGAKPTNVNPVTRLSYAETLELSDWAARRGREHLSHSAVESYESCSLSALLRDASRASHDVGAERPGWSRIGGSAFHLAAESIERGILAEPDAPMPTELSELWDASLDVAVKNAAAAVEASPYADTSTWHVANGGREGYDWWRVEGLRMVQRYVIFHDDVWRRTHTLLRINQDGALTPVLEFGYEMELAGQRVKGFVDSAWVSLSSTPPTIDIHDLKAGRSAPTSHFQLTEYAAALRQLLPVNFVLPIRGTFWLARKGEYTSPVTLDAAAGDAEISYRYAMTQRGYSAGVFGPHVTSLCSSCSVLDYCPAQATR